MTYVVRFGAFRACGLYLVAFDGVAWTASSEQREAQRFRTLSAAEFVAIGIGDARAVRLRPKRIRP